MPIKTSGDINFQDIIDEFGRPASGGVSLDDYRRGGSFVPNKNVNSNIPLAGTTDPISLSDFYGATKIITMRIKSFGGGGAGGSGFENNGNGSTVRGGTGGTSGFMLKSKWDALVAANNVIPKNIPITQMLSGPPVGGGANAYAGSIGGIGGLSGKFTNANATAGEESDFGIGGAAGARNRAGSSPTWGHWGAGGGGGGGDQGSSDSYFVFFNEGGGDDWGAAGEGGFCRDPSGIEVYVDLDVGVDYIICAGHGGYPATSTGNHDGGYGNPGYVEFTIDTDPGTVYKFEPRNINGGTNVDRYRTNYWGMRLNQSGIPEFFDVGNA
jgi:hypothetical protein